MADKIARAFGWKFAERFSAQVLNFLVSLLLARMLSPDDYGAVSLVLIFVSLAAAFVQTGLSTALIQTKTIEEDDYKSVLIFLLAAALLLYGLLYALSPLAAAYYAMPALCALLRAMALMLFPMACQAVQLAYLTREMQFGRIARCSLAASAAAAAVGIGIARCGGGAWALAVQQLLCPWLSCLALQAVIRRLPGGRFSLRSLKKLLPYGARVWASGFLVALFLDIRSMCIGKVYTAETLAFFNRGKQFPQAIMDSVNGSVQSVLLPVYARKQEKSGEVLRMVRQTVRMLTLIAFPLMLGLAALAEPLVLWLLTEKWRACVPYLQIFAVSYLLQTVQISSVQAVKALGDSSTPLRLEIAKKTVEMLLLALLIFEGPLRIAQSLLLAGLFSVVMTAGMARRRLGYRLRDQLADVWPALGCSLAMACAVLGVRRLIKGPALCVLTAVPLGALVYAALCAGTKNEAFGTLLRRIKRARKGGA